MIGCHRRLNSENILSKVSAETDLRMIVLNRVGESIDSVARVSIESLAKECGLSVRRTARLLHSMSEADLIDVFRHVSDECQIELYQNLNGDRAKFFDRGEFRLRISFSGKLFLRTHRAQILWPSGENTPTRRRSVVKELVAMPLPAGPMVHIKPQSVVDGPTFATDEYVGVQYEGRNYKCHVEEFVESLWIADAVHCGASS
jgi:hypothetical protein